jgi:ferrous iron transport protein A
MTLDQLPMNHPMPIHTIDGDPGFRIRLMELGLVAGTPIERVGQAPLGDPLTFRVRGAVLSIRTSDAQKITLVVPS